MPKGKRVGAGRRFTQFNLSFVVPQCDLIYLGRARSLGGTVCGKPFCDPCRLRQKGRLRAVTAEGSGYEKSFSTICGDGLCPVCFATGFVLCTDLKILMGYVSCQPRCGWDVGRCRFFVLGPGRQKRKEGLRISFLNTVKTPVLRPLSLTEDPDYWYNTTCIFYHSDCEEMRHENEISKDKFTYLLLSCLQCILVL